MKTKIRDSHLGFRRLKCHDDDDNINNFYSLYTLLILYIIAIWQDTNLDINMDRNKYDQSLNSFFLESGTQSMIKY